MYLFFKKNEAWNIMEQRGILYAAYTQIVQNIDYMYVYTWVFRERKKVIFVNVGEKFLKLCIWIEDIQEFFVLSL